jgi:hypothetical protein
VRKLEAEVVLEYDQARWAKAVADAVSADNVKAPAGLIVKTVCTDKKVVTRVEWQGKLPTFIATLDDLLFSASAAEKTLRVTEGLESNRSE